jgi:hypothetical protein
MVEVAGRYPNRTDMHKLLLALHCGHLGKPGHYT